MRITDMLRFAAERGEPVFSFEFFPPKNDAGVAALFETLLALRPLGPSFVSVTWGAAGSPRGRPPERGTGISGGPETEARPPPPAGAARPTDPGSRVAATGMPA